MIFQSLGKELENAFDFCYDYQLAVDELKFYKLDSIPKIDINAIPTEISNVKFSCNLSAIPFIEKTSLKSSSSCLLRSM